MLSVPGCCHFQIAKPMSECSIMARSACRPALLDLFLLGLTWSSQLRRSCSWGYRGGGSQKSSAFRWFSKDAIFGRRHWQLWVLGTRIRFFIAYSTRLPDFFIAKPAILSLSHLRFVIT